MRNGRLGLRLLLGLGLLAALGLPAGAANWPRFRGPNGTGVADDKNIPAEWTEKDYLWKVALPGVGNSSPIVWGDRVFLQCASADSKERLLVCVSAATGKILWTASEPGGRAANLNRKYNTLASSTPATDGQRVYCVWWDGTGLSLAAYDLDGKRVWKRDLGKFKSQHGAGASPIVVGDKVILNNDQDGSARLQAFDAKTGKPAWEVKRTAFRACYATPFVLERPGGPPELVVASTAGLAGYDPDSGKERWHWDWKFDGMALRTVGSPVYSKGILFALSGDGSGARHAVAVRIGSQGDVTKTDLAWQNKRNRALPHVPGPLVLGDHLYFINDRGVAACHEAATGKQVWAEELNCTVSASPVLIDGKVYAVSDDGDVIVFRASP